VVTAVAPAPERFDVRLVEARALSPSVREMEFERVDGRPLAFAPGQWVNLFVRGGDDDLKRAYSIASEPSGSSRFSVAVTHVEGGPASTVLHAIDIGTTITAVGPSGLFVRAATDPTPALFVGTGTGITPFRSMVRAALDAGSRAPMHLLMGVRHLEDAIYLDELTALQARHDTFRFTLTLSQPAAGWKGRTGYVQHHLAETYAALAATSGDAAPHVYACGLVRMVKAVREMARGELGVARTHVHQERYD
jgi:CDP-4-dehydro-6-deoxyglucose reductase, E3